MSLIRCQYSIVRYIDDPIRDEPRNVGVFLQGDDAHGALFAFQRPLARRLRGIASALDIKVAQAFLMDFAVMLEHRPRGQIDLNPQWGLIGPVTNREFMESLTRGRFGKLSFTEPRGVVTTNMDREIERLFRVFVAERPMEHPIRTTPLKSELRQELAAAHLLDEGTRMEQDHYRGFRANDPIRGGHSGVDHKVDFAFVNGHVFVAEAVDLRRTKEDARRKDAFRAAFTIDDLMRGLGPKRRWGAGFSLVALDDDYEGEEEIAIVRAYSKVFVVTNKQQRTEFIDTVRSIVNGRYQPALV